MAKLELKIGDSVQFVFATRRVPVNPKPDLFKLLAIDPSVYNQTGKVIGYQKVLKFFNNKRVPLVCFEFKDKWNTHRTYKYLIPLALLKEYEVESNHPHTKIFLPLHLNPL